MTKELIFGTGILLTEDDGTLHTTGSGGGGSGDASAAKQDTGNASLASIDTKTPALGQALSAASVPVVLTAAQLSTLTPPAAIAGFATSTLQGALTETAPATDTASSGLNGRLQRIAQRLTSLIALIPTSLGQKTSAASLAVVLPSDQIVAVSQNAVTIPAIVTLQNAVTANGNGTTLDVSGYAEAVLQITSSPAMSGGTIVNFEVSLDDTTWVSISAIQAGSLVTSTSTDGDFRFRTSGFKSFRARISGYSAGTVTVKAKVTSLSSAPITVGLNSGTQSIGAVSQGAGAAPGTSWRTAGDFVEVTATPISGLNGDLIASTDVSAYAQWSFQITAIGNAANVVSFQGSNDNSTFFSIPGLISPAVGATVPTLSSGSTALFRGDVFFRYLRIRVTSYTSGTATGILELRTVSSHSFTNSININGSVLTIGNKSNNGGAPSTTNVGMLPAVANAAAPSYVEGNQVSLRTDLAGFLGVAHQPYPLAATPETAASGNVANASAAATLATTSGKTTYITGFEVTAGGATAGAVVTVTVTGTITGTLSYTFAVPTGAVLAATPLIVEFTTPIPASATNTTIVVTCPALGTGNTNATVVAHGFQL